MNISTIFIYLHDKVGNYKNYNILSTNKSYLTQYNRKFSRSIMTPNMGGKESLLVYNIPARDNTLLIKYIIHQSI